MSEAGPTAVGTQTGARLEVGPESRRQRITRALSALFPDPTGVPFTRRGVLLAVLAVAAGAVLSLLRTGGTGPLQSVWQEDARDVLNDAFNVSAAHALIKPVAGYLIIGPRLLGELATLFPISWAAAVLSIAAALITAALAVQVYVASGAHFSNRFGRLMVAAPMLFAPVAENNQSEIYNRPVCLHFFAMYALFWVLLWSPATRAGRAGILVTVVMSALSTVLIVGYLPLALLRLGVRRDRLSLIIFGLIFAGSVLQLQGSLLAQDRMAGARPDPVWVVDSFVRFGLPQSMLGTRAIGGPLAPPNLSSTLLAWLILVTLVAAAVMGAQRRFLRPAGPLAVAAMAYSAGLFALMIVANGQITQRYLTTVELLLFAGLVALLLPAPEVDIRKSGALLAVFAVFVVMIGAINYRWSDTYRSHAPRWTEQIHQAAVRCRRNPQLGHVAVRGAPKPFYSHVYVPCHELKKQIRCHPPECVWLDPPQSLGPLRPLEPGTGRSLRSEV